MMMQSHGVILAIQYVRCYDNLGTGVIVAIRYTMCQMLKKYRGSIQKKEKIVIILTKDDHFF